MPNRYRYKTLHPTKVPAPTIPCCPSVAATEKRLRLWRYIIPRPASPATAGWAGAAGGEKLLLSLYTGPVGIVLGKNPSTPLGQSVENVMVERIDHVSRDEDPVPNNACAFYSAHVPTEAAQGDQGSAQGAKDFIPRPPFVQSSLQTAKAIHAIGGGNCFVANLLSPFGAKAAQELWSRTVYARVKQRFSIACTTVFYLSAQGATGMLGRLMKTIIAHPGEISYTIRYTGKRVKQPFNHIKKTWVHPQANGGLSWSNVCLVRICWACRKHQDPWLSWRVEDGHHCKYFFPETIGCQRVAWQSANAAKNAQYCRGRE